MGRTSKAVLASILAVSAVAQKGIGLKSQSYVANFTSIPEGDQYIFGDPPTLPGVYDDLYYDNIQSYLGPYHIGPDSGISPHSPYFGSCFGVNCLSFTNRLDDLPKKQGSISVNYNSSKVVSFDLKSFWFGCTEGNTTAIPNQPPDQPQTFTLFNPSNCTVTVKGYRLTNNRYPGALEIPDAIATFKYVPDSQPDYFDPYFLFIAGMKQFTLPKTFIGLRTVTLDVSNKTEIAGPSNSSYTSPAGYLDDISYTVLKRS